MLRDCREVLGEGSVLLLGALVSNTHTHKHIQLLLGVYAWTVLESRHVNNTPTVRMAQTTKIHVRGEDFAGDRWLKAVGRMWLFANGVQFCVSTPRGRCGDGARTSSWCCTL